MNLKQEIQELINKLTNDEISISKGLTIAKRLNNKIKNKKLENFILGEMEEKYDDDTLPEYRLVFGESTFEFKNRMTGMTDIRGITMPEGTHFNGKSINYRPILFNVSEIEQVVKETEKGETFKVSFTPGQISLAHSYLKKLIKQNDGWQLIRAWWSHSPTSFPAILFKSKQKLIDLLLEIENHFLERDYEEKIYSEKSHFDASFEISQLIEKAKSKIILIDGYVDGTTLKLISSKKESVSVQILTDPKSISDSFSVLADTFNKQYHHLEIKTTTVFHDRFLIIDEVNFYQIGASMKDLGKKTFSFIKLKEAFMTDALFKKFHVEWDKKTTPPLSSVGSKARAIATKDL